MSSENLQLVERFYDAFNKGERVDDLLHPEVEYVNPETAVEPGTRRGAKSWNEAFGNLRQIFEGGEVETERLIESGDRIAAVVTFHAKAAGSDLPVADHQSHLWTIEGGKIRRFEWFLDPDEAPRRLGEADGGHE